MTSNLPELISTEIFVPDHQLVQWERLFHLERMDADRTQAILESLVLSRELGDAWIGNRLGSLPQEKRGVVLQVPSAVISQEWNYLINPRSPGFHGIGWAEAQPFHVDPRLLFPDLR